MQKEMTGPTFKFWKWTDRDWYWGMALVWTLVGWTWMCALLIIAWRACS